MQTITFELTYLNYQGDSNLHIKSNYKTEETPTLYLIKFVIVF